jgi:hypothetical protein
MLAILAIQSGMPWMSVIAQSSADAALDCIYTFKL